VGPGHCTNAKRQVADAAARAEAKGVVERWNEQLAASRDTRRFHYFPGIGAFVDALPTDPRPGAASFDITIGKTPYRAVNPVAGAVRHW
jgi:hypothetical protein